MIDTTAHTAQRTTCSECDGTISVNNKTGVCYRCYESATLPTPEQIAKRAAEIRSEWTERDHRVRSGMTVQRVEVQRVRDRR